MALKLRTGDHIGIVGGGPAGSFAALHLVAEARRAHIELKIDIFEPRDFTHPGPAGCNRCAGILSSRLLRGLGTLDLELPTDVIQAEIHAYAVHLGTELFRLEQPDPQRRIVSVYRGGGPRLHEAPPCASFDAFLLNQAISRGAGLLRQRVRDITMAERPVIHTREGAYAVDLLVMATGVNSHAPLSPAFHYQSPKTAVMAQDEFLLPEHWPHDQVGSFFDDFPGLTFGAIIPKGRYVNVSLLGEGLRLDAIEAFAERHDLTLSLESTSGSLCGCTPRIAVGMGHDFWGDRWVAVGDAAVTRLYKDGIGSAYHTSGYAMRTAVRHGISHHDFGRGYVPYCRKVQRDNRYGHLLFRMWHLTTLTPFLRRAWGNAIRTESALPFSKKMHVRILWGMLTGDEAYRNLFWLLMTPGSILSLLKGLNHPWKNHYADPYRTDL
ncbi:MAG: hypothetical protein GXP37_08180 [Chloroflexi bacterium]|nr:hypothetical protein [Chloroflexota bacterium]